MDFLSATKLKLWLRMSLCQHLFRMDFWKITLSIRAVPLETAAGSLVWHWAVCYKLLQHYMLLLGDSLVFDVCICMWILRSLQGRDENSLSKLLWAGWGPSLILITTHRGFYFFTEGILLCPFYRLVTEKGGAKINPGLFDSFHYSLICTFMPKTHCWSIDVGSMHNCKIHHCLIGSFQHPEQAPSVSFQL